ncbi:beta-ketoacyl synthase [Geothermobacter hydrogeniphilus]|uniref:Beta-ketoacyl synthase n=1 Tax=Geothermobacter hydrogeniphilus TaxID=1969733 RepID=A0A2K2HBD4_9BACT|nr:beta-ketoacyl synthase chain length factor [Geothermobacter hydrogeniphilus]PNU20628.1 beta-ketoacyl synthase [Geothermobacter hydrogeniphilus]
MIAPLITGLGPVGGFGAGVGALRNALAGESRPEAYRVDLTPLERYLNRRATRRIDRFSQIGLLGACLALEDAGLSGGDLSRVGLILSSGYGPLRTTFSFLDSVLDDGDCLASPTHFSNSVHNAAAAHIGIQLGLTAPCMSLSQFELSVASGLQLARCWLAERRVDAVLFGAIDESCPVVDYCYRRYFGPAGERLEPWVLQRQTAVPGEGGCFMVLQVDPSAGRSYARLDRAEVCGISPGPKSTGSEDAPWVLGCDGHAGIGPRYAALLPAGSQVAAYAGLYGALPVGQAFDVTIAALGLEGGALYPCDPLPEGLAWQPAGHLGSTRVNCLKLAATGWGLVGLESV